MGLDERNAPLIPHISKNTLAIANRKNTLVIVVRPYDRASITFFWVLETL